MTNKVCSRNETKALFSARDQGFLAILRQKEVDDCVRYIFEQGLQRDPCEINSFGRTKSLYLQEYGFLILANVNDLFDNLILRLNPVGRFELFFWYVFVLRTLAVRKQTHTVDLFDCTAI